METIIKYPRTRMKLDDILSVSGKPGLYRLVAQSRNGLIAEALADGKRISVSASQQVSSLKDIAIYTYGEEVNLADIFAAMRTYASDQSLPDLKASKEEMLDFFRQVLPEFDEERVYASHVKKVLSWYLILDQQGLLKEDESETTAEVVAEEVLASTEEAQAEEAPASEDAAEEQASEDPEEKA